MAAHRRRATLHRERAGADLDAAPGSQRCGIPRTGREVSEANRRPTRRVSQGRGQDLPPVTSIKRVTGHAAGASGAYEAVAAALTIHRAQLPPVGIEVEPDPELQVPLVIGPARAWAPAPVLSNSFGLGGHNGCLVLAPA